MRAAITTSNLAATQLFKTNRKQREEQEHEPTMPSFLSSGHFRSSTKTGSAFQLIAVQDRRPSISHHGEPVQRHAYAASPNNKRLRAAKLGDLSREEICLESMRKLFRLLDEDGGGTVDAVELKKGMELLGFEEVANPVALDRLVREIDEDKTGTIEENEFLAYFSHESRSSLKQKLQSWCLNHTHISATRYRAQGKPDVQVAEISTGSAAKWLREVMAEEKQEYNYWLDITGYDRHTFTEMAQALGFSHDDFAEMLVGKKPECTVVKGSHGLGASFIVPSAKLSQNPVRRNAGIQFTTWMPSSLRKLIKIVLGDHSTGVPDYLTNRRLAKKKEIAKITISLEQAAIFVANQHVVLTFRCPIRNYEHHQLATIAAMSRASAPLQWKPYGSHPQGLKRSTTVSVIETAWGEGSVGGRKSNAVAPAGTVSPFAQENSTVRLQFEWLRSKLASQCASTSLAANSDVKILAVLLVDQLLTSNYVIRDRVQDWEELVEACIRGVENAASTHLEAMGGLLDRFIDHLEPLAKMLSPKDWDGGQAQTGETKSKRREEEGEEDSGKKRQQKRKGLGAEPPPITVSAVTGVVGQNAEEEVRVSRRRGGESFRGASAVGSPAPDARRRSSEVATKPSSALDEGLAPIATSPALEKRLKLSVSLRRSSLNPLPTFPLPGGAQQKRSELRVDAIAPGPWAPGSKTPRGVVHLPDLVSPRESKGISMVVPAGLQKGSDTPVAVAAADSGWSRGDEAEATRSPVGSGAGMTEEEPALRDMFRAQLQDFEEIATDVACLVEASMARHDRVDNLARRLNNAKQDMINRTLYALTLVTAIATPVTICTGIYGMNFEDMPELDPTIPGREGYGYSFFWKLICVVVCSMVFFLYRLGLFKTLL